MFTVKETTGKEGENCEFPSKTNLKEKKTFKLRTTTRKHFTNSALILIKFIPGQFSNLFQSFAVAKLECARNSLCSSRTTTKK